MNIIGVISDTHGLMRLEALDALRGCQLIIHAGDVGSPDVLQALGRLGRVVAVRGNVDREPWAERLPATQVVEVDHTLLYVLHDVNELDLDPAAAGFRVVIAGHSHQPSAIEKQRTLYVNPGSAGPRRFRLPITVARLQIEDGTPSAEIIPLPVH